MRKPVELDDAAFRAFFEASPQAMWVFSLSDLRFLAVNRAACKQYGFTEREFMGMTLKDVRSAEEQERLIVAIERVREQRTHASSEVWEHRTKDGRTLKVEVLATTLSLGNADLGFAVLHDVTRAYLLQDNLARAQQVSHIGSWSYDIASNRFTLSEEYYRITGHEPGGYEPTWPNILACVHPDDRHLVDLGSSSQDAANWKPQQLEVRMLRPSGEVRYVVSSFDATFNPDGSPMAISGTIQDVTDQRQAEETRRWLAEIVSSSSDSIIGSTLNGIVLSWNRASEQLFGYSAQEMVGQPLLKLIPAKRWGEASALLTKLRNGERVSEIETERVDKDGRVFDVSFTVSPVHTEDGRIIGAATISRDITSRKRTERQMAAQVAQLTALRNIDGSIARGKDLATTLGIVVDQTVAATGVDSVWIFLKKPASNGLQLAASASKESCESTAGQFQRASVVAGSAIEKGRIASSGLAGNTFLGQDDDRTGPACDARPLMVKGRAAGALAIEYETGVKREADLFYFLDTLAGQAARALEAIGVKG